MYQFHGFFAMPRIEQPSVLPEGVIWREIDIPFEGVGVRLPVDETPDAPTRDALARELNIVSAMDWMYISYVCWGGSIDSVYAYGKRGHSPFGPITETDDSRAHSAYIRIMSEFGVSEKDASQFPPFVRGFWGVA